MTEQAGEFPIDALYRAIARPPLFAPHDGPFWDDPYIARQMLLAHLDPSTDAASRRPPAIDATVAHLAGAGGLKSGASLLDLGCGPGLYAQRFAGLGLRVTGLDLSASSIDHAAARAREASLDITYRVADYTRADLGGPYDAAVLIYMDFGVLAQPQRDRLLDAVSAALVPGGWFALDVFTPRRSRRPDGSVRVGIAEGGFWRPDRHLVVETTYRYGPRITLDQTAIVDSRGTVTAYRVWDRTYGLAELRGVLRRHGLVIERHWADLAGTPWERSSPTLGVIARRALPS